MIPIAKPILEKLGYVHISEIRKQLNFAGSVGKRLDEHREVVEAIEENTSLFQEKPWHIRHMAAQDDYLIRLYHLVHGCWPTDQTWPTEFQPNGEYVRTRPSILGRCQLEEYWIDQSSAVRPSKEVSQ